MKEDCYSEIANYFDEVVGERSDIEYIKNLVQRHHPRARSVLEIACGTGAVLEHFVPNFDVEGLDLSLAMLKKAKKRFGPARFLQQDMRNFSTGRTYDVILCVFNSINHLHKFTDWKKVFKSAYRHLNPGGIFVFDIMTIYSLRAFAKEPVVFQKGEDKYLILNYTTSPNKILNMNIQVFVNQGKKKFKLLEGVISEKSFPTAKVKISLESMFKKCVCLDPERKRGIHRFSEVVFFVATK
jgi:SAM-dependent methyltransferase